MAEPITTESRRLDRERVLSLLYEAEMKGEAVATVLASLPVPPDDFVRETCLGVGRSEGELDRLIDQYAQGWDLDRMPSIDKNILRIGAYELRERPDLSIAVINSEAVELAKRYSTEDAGRFVNGMLQSIAGEVRSDS